MDLTDISPEGATARGLGLHAPGSPTLAPLSEIPPGGTYLKYTPPLKSTGQVESATFKFPGDFQVLS